MEPREILLEDGHEVLQRHRWWFVGAVLMLGIGIFWGQPLAVAAGIIAGMVTAIPEIWFRRGLRSLVVRQSLSAPRAFLGDWVTLHVRVEQHDRLPLPWLLVRSDLPRALEAFGHPLAGSSRYLLPNAFSLSGRRGVERTIPLFCAARGLHQTGPVSLTVADPLNWVDHLQRLRMPQQTILVLPAVVPLSAVKLQAMFPAGELPSKRRLIDDPLRQAGVREYQRGDDPRHLHWKVTARVGALMTKVFDPGGQYRFVIVLDVNSYGTPLHPIEPAVLELSICVAASLGMWALDEHFAVGILSNGALAPLPMLGEMPAAPGAETLWLPPSQQPTQRERLLESLALLPQDHGVAMEPVLLAYRRQFVAGTTVVFIGTAHALTPEVCAQLSDLRRRDVAAHVALVGDQGIAAQLPALDVPIHHIGGREMWHAIIAAARQYGATGPSRTTHFHLG
jgi:uncharacterized protein (DUF58 family)